MNTRDTIRWCLSVPADTPAHRLCLVALVANASPAGTLTMPQAELAAAVGISPRHVRAIVAHWERQGIVTRQGTAQEGTTYALNIPAEAARPAPTKRPEGRQGKRASAKSGAEPQFRGADPQFRGGAEAGFRPLGSTCTEVHTPSYPITPVVDCTLYRSPIASFDPKRTEAPPLPQPPELQPPGDGGTSDLLGLPLGDDPDQLLRTAIETYQAWQAKLPNRRRRQLRPTPSRTTKFLRLWRTVLQRNMTRWRQVCQACTRSSILSGVEGRWDGADFDWLLMDDHASRILSGFYRADYDPEPPIERIAG